MEPNLFAAETLSSSATSRNRSSDFFPTHAVGGVGWGGEGGSDRKGGRHNSIFRFRRATDLYANPRHACMFYLTTTITAGAVLRASQAGRQDGPDTDVFLPDHAEDNTCGGE
jgi:hypothetical protein